MEGEVITSCNLSEFWPFLNCFDSENRITEDGVDRIIEDDIIRITE